MEWAQEFYSTTGKWWGPAEAVVSSRDHERVRMIEHCFGGTSPKTVLELGSGYGTTAAAAADAGYHVTAIELSERILFAKQFESHERRGTLCSVRGDFYTVDVGSSFDVVTYWNGFGIGSDADQRRLLRRIADEWLAQHGKALIDVGNPFVRASWNGDEEFKTAKPEAHYHFSLQERTQYDPVHNRFVDTWWEANNQHTTYSQSLRCYTPADLLLLLESTGLCLESVYAGGQKLDLDDEHLGNRSLLKDEQEYLAVLTGV